MYRFSTTTSLSFEEAKAAVTEALAGEGFGVLTEIDVKAVLKKKLDHDHEPYVILGACNPVLAEKAIASEPDIGLLLPCNVVVRPGPEGKTVVSFMDPRAVLSLVDSPEVATLADEVRSRLERVRDTLPS